MAKKAGEAPEVKQRSLSVRIGIYMQVVEDADVLAEIDYRKTQEGISAYVRDLVRKDIQSRKAR